MSSSTPSVAAVAPRLLLMVLLELVLALLPLSAPGSVMEVGCGGKKKAYELPPATGGGAGSRSLASSTWVCCARALERLLCGLELGGEQLVACLARVHALLVCGAESLQHGEIHRSQRPKSFAQILGRLSRGECPNGTILAS